MAFLDQLKARLSRFGPAPQAPKPEVSPGLYHYRRDRLGERTRLHLRVDPDGRGLLVVNASRVYHLNPTASMMAYLALEETPEVDAVRRLSRLYRAPGNQLRDDYAQFCAQFQELTRPDGACPVCDLELETELPFTARPTAPYRMDLALTYRCNNNCSHCYNARPRSHPELDTASWKRILDRTWELRIPHVVFTGGEPTLRPDLFELIAHAEHSGQITGLNTNARRLCDPAFVERLVDSGLDHVQITLESHDPAIHDAMVGARGAWEQTVAGLRNSLKTSLFVMTNTTMLRHNSPGLAQTLDFLAELGVPTLGLNALIYSGLGKTVGTGLAEADLSPLLDLARRKTDQTGQRLIWYTPTEYCHFDPMALDLGVKGCTAALYNMCVEPDGSIIPCQSYYQALGSLLDDSWESIWNHPVAVDLRERRNLPVGCQTCSLLTECGGGCPLAREDYSPSSPNGNLMET